MLWSAIAFMTPPWEANDEPWHVQNVERLAGGHWYRISDPGAGFEAHQAPLYYLLLAAWQRGVLGLGEAQPAPTLAPGAIPPPPRNYQHAVATDGADQRLVDGLRLPGVALGLLTLLLTARAARAVSEDPWTPVVAAGLVAGVPKFGFLSAVVNNDNLSNTIGAALLLAVLSALRAGAGTSMSQRSLARYSGVIGALFGALVLAKASALTAGLPVLVFGALLVRDRRQLITAGACCGAAALAVCGWWLVQNQVRYGDPLAAKATQDHLEAILPSLFDVGSFGHQAFSDTPQIVFRSFWYSSGWNQLVWTSDLIYAVLWIWLAAGLAGLASRRRQFTLWAGARGAGAVLWSMVLAGALAIWILGVQTTTSQARVGFFALPALGVLYAVGVERLRAPVLARLALPCFGLALTVIALRRDVIDFFPS